MSEEIRTIVDGIDAAVARVLDRIQINTWIFSVVAFVTLVLGVCMIFMLVQQSRNYALAKAGSKIALKANKLAATATAQAEKNRVRQDIMDKQYSDYVNQTVQVWNKLQGDNVGKIKVPIAPTLRPAGLPLPKDEALERITRPGPKPPPIVIIQKKTVTPRPARRTPTPRPWTLRDFFKSTR